jgi:hypothetical protein
MASIPIRRDTRSSPEMSIRYSRRYCELDVGF